MKLVSVEQMREIETQANAGGLSYEQMMENAGRGLAEIVNQIALNDDLDVVLGLAGPGNNGGDTLVALTHLAEDGWEACAYVLKRKKKDELIARLLEAGGKVIFAESDKDFSQLNSSLEIAEVFLDGLLGTGVKLPLKPEAAVLLGEMNEILADLEEPPIVVAVDCPSGVDCDSGQAAAECIPADLTVTMAAIKRGLLKLPAFELVGDISLAGIGLPDDFPPYDSIPCEVADHQLISGLLPERRLDSHKGSFGTALVIAGSVNYTGAALLAGMAAYRSGVGLVNMAVPSPLYNVLAGQFPEAIWTLLPNNMGTISGSSSDITQSLGKATAILIGPGLGQERSTAKFLEALLSTNAGRSAEPAGLGFVVRSETRDEHPSFVMPPMVVDADGLRILATMPQWQQRLAPETILTPHPGEMSALTGLSKEDIQADREAVALKYAKEWGHVVVLKGAFTIIASPEGRTTLIPVASPALARAGTGDVLAGLITGLRAQGLDAYDAAVAGAYIHAQAGLLAADDMGTTASVLAGDVLSAIADVISELE